MDYIECIHDGFRLLIVSFTLLANFGLL